MKNRVTPDKNISGKIKQRCFVYLSTNGFWWQHGLQHKSASQILWTKTWNYKTWSKVTSILWPTSLSQGAETDNTDMAGIQKRKVKIRHCRLGLKILFVVIIVIVIFCSLGVLLTSEEEKCKKQKKSNFYSLSRNFWSIFFFRLHIYVLLFLNPTLLKHKFEMSDRKAEPIPVKLWDVLLEGRKANREWSGAGICPSTCHFLTPSPALTGHGNGGQGRVTNLPAVMNETPPPECQKVVGQGSLLVWMARTTVPTKCGDFLPRLNLNAQDWVEETEHLQIF